MNNIKSPAGLLADIAEVCSVNMDRPVRELLYDINSPGRIQRRGYAATAEQLLMLVISMWQVDENSRFGLYDLGKNQMSECTVFRTKHAADEVSISHPDIVTVGFKL